MHAKGKLIAVLVAASSAAGLGSVDANALPRCRAPVEASATATGILGAGSAKARTEARAHWKATVARLYGPRYADFRNARNRQWDCKKGAILLAKCVVVASPCRY
ncbi:MAG TPA: hypothetical protein VM620_08710 [Hyphomicrobium sp.]|jgi:hypothetical protein|nr:hypothetical protein [Hyphomicrobium sp.]